ncbi:MAG: hypothetical protein H7838_12295 [Magnetococcus sp. DMHC-8]
MFKNFVPYLFGVLIGIGFFFLLIHGAPLLLGVPVSDGPAVAGKKEVPVPVPPQRTGAVGAPAAVPVPVSPQQAPVSPQQAPGSPQQAVGAPAAVPSGVSVGQSEGKPAVVTDRLPVPAIPPAREVESSATSPVAPTQDTVLSDLLATEQPLEAELERDPVEMAVPRAAPAPSRAGAGPVDCGTPPTRPGRSMDQYLACQWRADCLSRLDRARGMIERDKRRCPTVGNDAQACLAYYHALELQYHPSLCGGGWPAGQMPGWW